MALSFLNYPDPQNAAKHLRSRLISKLVSQMHVTWLISGGSNIELSVAVIKSIPESLLAQLTILQTDERYGDYDHKDSNWLQLCEAGFDASGAKIETILTKDNLSLEETVKRYDRIVKKVFDDSSIIIGQFGIGQDGHIAGILPGSPAVDNLNYVAGYETKQFTRITLTPNALKLVDVAYAFAFGESKKEALDNLYNKKLTISKQPSQVLKDIKVTYVYNDQIKKIRGK